MTLGKKLPTTMLGKVSLAFIALALFSWLFVNNAQNCLSRDFIFPPYPSAVCWRRINDYEDTIRYSRLICLVLVGLAIICSSASMARLQIKRSPATPAERRKTTILLGAFSILLLIFIITVSGIWYRTAYNGNNYFLNTANDAATKIGAPAWLALTSVTVVNGWHSFRRKPAKK